METNELIEDKIIESQNKRIRKYLESGRKLTGMDSLYMFGCWRLPARVNDLKKLGLIIDSKFIEITSPAVYSGKKHVKEYFIKRK